MPSIISTGAASARAFGNEFGGLFVPPNVFVYNTTSSYGAYNTITKTAIDSAGNFYIAGVSNSSSSPFYGCPYLIKTNSSGSILWSTEIVFAKPTAQYVKDIFIDNSNNIWMTFNEATGPTYYGHLLILNSSGAYVNGYSYRQPSGVYTVVMSSLCKDSSGNVYVAYSYLTGKSFIYKFTSTSSYSLFASVTSGGGTDSGDFGILLCDSSDNIYALGMGQFFQSGFYKSITKIKSSGTFVSAYYYYTAAAGYDGSTINTASIDSSNNIYLYGTAFDSTSSNQTVYSLTKINSSLAIVNNYNITLQSIYTPFYTSSIVGGNLITSTSGSSTSQFATINVSGATPTINYPNNFVVSGTPTYSTYTGFNFDGTYAYVFFTLNQTPSTQILWGKIEYTNAVTRTTPTIVDNPSFTAVTQATTSSTSAYNYGSTSITTGTFGTAPTIASETPTLTNSFASGYATSTW